MRHAIPAVLLLCVAGPAFGQMGPGLDLSWHAVDCGGGVLASGSLSLTAAVGQPDAGRMGAGDLELRGGFIPTGAAPAACYPDCNSDGTLNLSDFGCFQTRFALGNSYADCNGDDVLNLSDFGCFQTKFALGCP
jgi:hypothetical protein